ncbi:XRE family transcriptional regulator [Streptomyces sp. SID12488]|uniref:XRE family transcriptional regulator n=1 Tax=Streptomyces sp. SID12488 TaxID=2706040 RepID=UPI0013D98376|nr:XRE family transcriptional regulator [Streptomyces sp. SID12488]NEA62329.1 XRE family transcriptional regulator [Streptomyces sp. SID12488]
MPRWRALPDELDPQVREFASQLRRLVDRSGLNIAALADRTGYSKTSWERYLNGRLLAPKGAIVALAEVTGTNPVHLTTMWELAERAWSRSEMRHDMTMEAIRISQARAALGEFGATAVETKNGSGKSGRSARSATVTPGIAGPAGVSPTVPPQPTATETRDSAGDVRAGAARGGVSGGSVSSASSSGSVSAESNSWGMAGYQGPAARGGAGGRPASPSGPAGSSGASGFPSAPPWTPGTPTGARGEPPQDARPAGSGGSGGSRRKRRLTMFLAGVVGASVVVAAAWFFTNQGDDTPEASKPSASPTTSVGTNPDLPVGVKCSGAACTGKDPENMGCGGELAQTANSVTVGTTLVEVRYSKTCQAAWARITQAAPGDQVDVTASGAAKQAGAVDTDTDAYTPMVAVKDAGDATACVTLKATGQKGCTQ